MGGELVPSLETLLTQIEEKTSQSGQGEEKSNKFPQDMSNNHPNNVGETSKSWRGGNRAIQKISVTRVIQTIFSKCSDRCFDGITATFRDTFRDMCTHIQRVKTKVTLFGSVLLCQVESRLPSQYRVLHINRQLLTSVFGICRP